MQGVASGALNRMPLNREAQVLRFLADRVRRESDCRDALVSVIRLSAADATVAVAAANALTILNRSGVSISASLAAAGADLRDTVAPGADLSNALLAGMIFVMHWVSRCTSGLRLPQVSALICGAGAHAGR